MEDLDILKELISTDIEDAEDAALVSFLSERYDDPKTQIQYYYSNAVNVNLGSKISNENEVLYHHNGSDFVIDTTILD